MSGSHHRGPAAFPISPEAEEPEAPPKRASKTRRRPQAISQTAIVKMTAPEDDPFFAGAEDTPLPTATPPRRGFGLLKILFATLGALFSLAVGLWVDQLIRDLFLRADWLGWLAVGLTGVVVFAIAVAVIRELLTLRRLASVEKFQTRALDALARNETSHARELVDDLCAFLGTRPETVEGLKKIRELDDEIIDGPDLIRLAEIELLEPFDHLAKKAVLDAAKRVSVVTAVSPRALVDTGYVLFEAIRLIRKLSAIYGGRPGTFGFLRLARNVIAHLAVTGTVAIGDGMVSQVLGHGLAARLSARLGEGVLNGLMTARIGIAAMEASRPLPFTALERPGITQFLRALAGSSEKTEDKDSQ